MTSIKLTSTSFLPKGWMRLQRKLKDAFRKEGIFLCELRYGKCFKNKWLRFAHSRKLNRWRTQEEQQEVVVTCRNCNVVLQLMPEEERLTEVKSIIVRRGKRIRVEV